MQNREDIRQKGTIGVQEQRVTREGENIIFNIIFGSKCTPLRADASHWTVLDKYE
jgi:hypothetical protein